MGLLFVEAGIKSAQVGLFDWGSITGPNMGSVLELAKLVPSWVLGSKLATLFAAPWDFEAAYGCQHHYSQPTVKGKHSANRQVPICPTYRDRCPSAYPNRDEGSAQSKWPFKWIGHRCPRWDTHRFDGPRANRTTNSPARSGHHLAAGRPRRHGYNCAFLGREELMRADLIPIH